MTAVAVICRGIGDRTTSVVEKERAGELRSPERESMR